MSLSLKQAAFLLIFVLTWLLLLLLGESYLDFVLLGVVTFIWWLFRHHLRWNRVIREPGLVLIWILFWLALGASTFFTSNFPLSLSAASHYLFASYIFWFIYLLDDEFAPKYLLLEALLLATGTMIIISFFFNVFPSLAHLLPDMNLIHATYGHNHLAALLLLTLPLSWWVVDQKMAQQSNQFNWYLLLPTIITLDLLTSFGRVAIVLGFFQILAFWIFWSPRGWIKKTIILIISVFSLILAVLLFFSLINFFQPKLGCLVPSLEKQLCKSLTTEDRPHYWRWALQIFQSQPFFGSGPGTFGIAAQKYQLKQASSTVYAHNIFLHVLAEMGLIGGLIFFILMVTLLFKGLARIDWQDRQSFLWSQAIALSLLVTFCNVLFDFDWHFIGIFSLTFVFLALLLKNKNSKKKSTLSEKNKRLFVAIAKLFFNFINLILIVTTLLFLLTEYFIRYQTVSQAFQIFPYFRWHRKIYQEDPSLTQDQQQKLLKIYRTHPSIYQYFLSKSTEPTQKQQLKEAWIKLDPWRLVSLEIVDYYLERREWVQAATTINQIFNFMQRIEQQTTHNFSYERKKELAQQMNELALGFYSSHSPQKAATWVARSRWADKWQLHHQPPLFSVTKVEVTAEEKLDFISQLYQLVPVEAFGQHKSLYIEAYYQALIELIEKHEFDLLRNYFDRDLHKEQYSYEQRLQLTAKLQGQALNYIKENQLEKATIVTELMALFFPEDYWTNVQSANLALIKKDHSAAKKLFQACLQQYSYHQESTHYHCQLALDQIDHHVYDAGQYFDVAQKIINRVK